MKRAGFSLVEALVVIAIISAAAALLMPVTDRVRQRARTEVKVQQLRQLSAATLIYMNSHDDRLPLANAVGDMEWHRLILDGASQTAAAVLLNPDKRDDDSVMPGLQSLGYSLNQCLSLGPFSSRQPSTEFNPYLIVQAAELKSRKEPRVYTITFEIPCHDRVYAELHDMSSASGLFLADSDQGGSVAARFDGSIDWAPYAGFKSKGCSCSYPKDEPDTPFQTFHR